MVPKIVLAIILVGVLAWTTTCGRSRTTPPSDTPVPTLTPLATQSLLPTVEATATTEVAASESITESVEVDATAMVSETTGAATPEATAPEVMTDTESVSRASEISLTEAMTEPVPTEGVTVTESITEVALLAPTSAPTSEPTSEPTVEQTATSTATPRPTNTARATSTPRPTVTPQPTSTPLPAATATSASTPTATTTATASATATATEAAQPTVAAGTELTASAQVTATASVTPTGARPSGAAEVGGSPLVTSTVAPQSAITPRTEITLPADLAISVRITNVTLLTEVVEDALPVAAELSPDGNSVAWLVPEQARRLPTLCIASVQGAGQNCHTVEGYHAMPYRLVWSPDSQWIAFSEDPAAQAIESDLWLFDVTNETLVNRTDDQMSGRYADLDGDFALDYLPVWDPATGLLYFWRSTTDAEGTFALDLMRLDPATEDAPEIVRALGRTLGDGLIRFGWQRFYLQGPAAIAPDGSQLVVSIAPSQEMDVSSGHALWLIDLVDGDAEPQELATALAWQEALPAWSNQPAVARGVQWTEDGQGILVAALSSDLRLPLLLVYYLDVASGTVSPVIDFSDSRDREAFFRVDPLSGHAPRFDVPWTIALAPDVNVLLMVTDLAGVVRVSAVPLPPDGSAPKVLHERRSPGYEVWTRSSSGGDVVLVYGLLMHSNPVE